jgi:arginine/ornithine N-succinyltransferase beta subunit
MIDSILLTIKKMLGIDQNFDGFDIDLIIHINSALMILNQLGVGVINFKITGSGELWSGFLGTDADIESIKSYIYLKTRLTFDPPANSFLVDAIQKEIKELEWRLQIQKDFII